MTTKRVFIGTWLAGAAVDAILIRWTTPVPWEPGPTDLLRFILFWPLFLLESAGQSACVQGCASLTLFLTEDLNALLPLSLLDTLTFLIVCAAVAWLIVRWRRPTRRRMAR